MPFKVLIKFDLDYLNNMYFVKNLIHKLLNLQISIVYSKRFEKYFNTPKGVFWNSKLSQDLRLNIILDKIVKGFKPNEFSIADVGCGYGRLFEIIKERNLDYKIQYYGFDVNKKFISFCSNEEKFKNGNFEINTCPSKNVDYVIMSGTYNLTPTKNINLWEDYIISNLKSNWKFADRALIFNCLINKKRKIQNGLYYSELSWIKSTCECHFGKAEIFKHNLLTDDVTIIIKKLK